VVVAMIAIAAAVVYKTRAEPRRSRRDRKKSAPKPLGMRERILWKDEFAAAVFVRGMCGIIDEHRMFVERAPDAVIVPVASAGGAAAILAREIGADPALLTSLDLRRTLHAHLGIDPTEARFRRLASSRGTLSSTTSGGVMHALFAVQVESNVRRHRRKSLYCGRSKPQLLLFG
jgi:hypothetical protein